MNEQSRKLLADYVAAKTPGEQAQGAAWTAINERIAGGDMGPNLPEEAAASGGSGVLAKGLLAGLITVAALYGGLQLIDDDGPPPAPAVAETSTPTAEPAPAPQPTAERSPTVVMDPTPEEPEEPAVAAPEPPAAATRSKSKQKPRAQKSVEPPTPETEPPTASTLAAEMALLAKAQRALKRGDPTRALQLFDQHAREYPQGELSDERRVQRARALCDLGRETEALAAVEKFRKQRPNSPLVGKASRICKDGGQ